MSYKKVILIIVVLLLAFAGFLYHGFVTSGIPTKGEKIAAYDKPQKALFVMDIQEDLTGIKAHPKSPYRDSAQIIDNVNRAIAEAQKKGMLIVYIKQVFRGAQGVLTSKLLLGGVALEGKPGTEIDSRIKIVTDKIFTKSIGDAFSNPELDALLIKNKINEIYLTGLDAQYCVYFTEQGALNRGYKVNVLTDSILLSNKEKWDYVIERYKNDGVNLIDIKGL